MANRKLHLFIRRSHRYLGLILGIQFFFWTIGGLYFSWSNIDEIHGDLQHKHVSRLTGGQGLVSPESALVGEGKIDSINTLQLVNILGKPFYSITYFQNGDLKKMLADARTGSKRNGVTKAEAVQIAGESFLGEPKVKSVAFITSTNGHHEYREKPLPAWAVSFDHPTNTTVYVSVDYGKVESFRNDKWRVFDLLWMMHTMDYEGRDNINNLLLRAFSVFGLVTILSGFALYFVSSKFMRRNKR